MPEKYNAAIIGLGYIGGADQVSGDALGQKVEDLDGTHFHALFHHPRVNLVAGSSRDEGRRQRFSERSGGVRTYASWRELLDGENLDIVSVATYAPQHAEITIECAQRGIRSVYCEKPVAQTMGDADAMLEACKASETLLAINHNRRFTPAFRTFRDRVAAGDLGELTSASVQWPNGRLGNVGTHMFDTVRMITGRKVEAVSGTLDLSKKPDCRGDDFTDPGGWGILRLEGGTMVTVDAADYATLPMCFRFNGTAGTATIDFDNITIDFADGTNEKLITQRDKTTAMDIAVKEIIQWLDGDVPFSYPATEAVDTLETIVAFHASHNRNAAWTSLPLQEKERKVVVNSG